MYEIYGVFSTEINTKLKNGPLEQRTKIIVAIFLNIIYECDNNDVKVLKIMDENIQFFTGSYI